MRHQQLIAAIARRTRALAGAKACRRRLPLPALDLPRDIILMRRSPRRYPTTTPIIHADQYMLVLTVRGGGTAVINKVAFKLRPRQALLVFPHQFHHFTGVAGHDFLWLFCSFRIAHNQAIMGLKDTPAPIRETFWPAIHALAADYCNFQRLTPRRLGRIAVNLWTLLLGLADTVPAGGEPAAVTPHPGRDMVFLETLQTYLINHLHEELSAAEIATHMRMSRRSLYQQFQAVMETGLAKHIHRLRVQKAGSLLNATDLTISQIAGQVGYTSVFSFSRAFKHATRLSPSAYRAAHAPRHGPCAPAKHDGLCRRLNA